MFHHFQSIVNKLRSNKPLLAPAYTDLEQALKLLYALDQKVWEVKVSAIIELANYDTLTVDELFSKLKATEVDKLSRARLESPSSGRPMVLVGSSSANANPNLSSGFAPSSLVSVIEEQMEALDDDSLALVIAKFQKFYTNRRDHDKEGRSICYNCGDKNHFVADCPKKRAEY